MKIITPYVNDAEILEHKEHFWEYDIYYEKDEARIGSDLMFQRIWNKFPNEDIFILHADMYIFYDNWLTDLEQYIAKYPEAGMIGCLLLYPVKSEKGNFYIQSAGGKFTENRPDHYGSGLILETKQKFKEHLEEDTGQYNNVREVAWTTFGGCFIRRSFIDSVGDFPTNFSWTYNRDVDYCLSARQKGQKIYQVPVRLFHHESRDNKQIKRIDQTRINAEARNLQILQEKWSGSDFYQTLDRLVDTV